MPLYFAYGSNMDDFQMRERCPNAKFEFVARLGNYSLSFPRKSAKRHGGVSSVRQVAGDEVWDVVYSLSEHELSVLGNYEGYNPNRKPDQNAYNRIETQVEDVRRKIHACWMYVATAQGEFLPSRERYLNYLIRGAGQHVAEGIPSAYVDKLRKVRAAED
jgi:hypothetical protein